MEHPQLPKLPITAWQIWNEQNSPSFFRPLPKVRSYAHPARHGARRHRPTRDPSAKIILGGMFGNPRGGTKPVIPASEYLARLYRRPGAAEDFNGVAAHPYAGTVPEMAAQVKLLHRRDRAGGRQRVGCGSPRSGGPPVAHRARSTRVPRDRPTGSAKAYGYFLARRKRLRIKTVDWFSWRDGPDTGVGRLLLVPGVRPARPDDGTPKPSLAAFASLTGGA